MDKEPKPASTVEDFLLDADGDLTDEAEEELPVAEFDDERDPEERADGYPLDEDTGVVACECSMWPCVHNNPRPDAAAAA